MVIPFLTIYLTQKGYTLTQAGIIMACFGAGAIAGGYIGGKFTDRFGFYWVQVFSLLWVFVYCFKLHARFMANWGLHFFADKSWRSLIQWHLH